MKNIICFFLFFIISFSYSQPNEGETVRFQFVKVEKGDIEEFEIFMTDFVGKAASKAVENGKLENWIFRRVSQNSEYNSQFSHMIIWVVPKNTPTWPETWDATYPGLSADSRSWAWSKGQELYETVYNARCTYITGFNHTGDKVNNIATFNLIKANNINAYSEFEKNMKKTLEKHAPSLKGWHVLSRNGSVTRSENAWNFLTIDTFESMADANKVWWSEIPQKINESNIKKYGSASDLRVIQHRVVTRLLFDAKNGKFEN